MKLRKKAINKINIFVIFIIFFLITPISSGIIEPDDILPLEITPSYTDPQGLAGTKFVFRFYIPNYSDKDSMPTMRGYGATNGQYIGLRFTSYNNLFDINEIGHSCEMIQIENNLNISLIALNDEKKKDVIYCKIDSYSNENIILPGHNYKLTITILKDMTISIQKLISITIFTSTSPNSEENEIIDIGTFNHINILLAHNEVTQSNSVANLIPETSSINIEVETNFNFDVRINFNEWFSWDDYIICIDLPKNQVSADNPVMEITKPSGSNIEVPYGDINSINLESNDKRKFIGFYLDGSTKEYSSGDILLLKFSGLKSKEAGLINEENNSGNGYIGVQIRYRNSYVICASKKIEFIVSLGNVKFTVKHPESSDDGTYTFDVFKGGAFQIEFNLISEKNFYNKYIVIKQKNANVNQRVTFIASSCDFSSFDITSTNFNEIPKCYPIKNRNFETGEDKSNGIFFYYPYIMRANINYKLRVWMFFDECGPETISSDADKKREIKFSLEIYNDINKNKIAENRFDSNFIFLKEIETDKGITCYNNHMGEKRYNNGYTFNMGDYSTSDKLLYREYFNWNVYGYSSESNEGTDGEKILENLFEIEKGEIKPKFIYTNTNDRRLVSGTNLLLVSKITLDSGNNEQLGQFFPMGLTKSSDGSKNAIKDGKFFIKLSKNFFEKASTSQCYVSWAFGSPSISKGDDLYWKPKAKTHPRQKYNFIVSSKDFFSDDSTVLIEPMIEKIEDNYLESKENEGWDATQALWSFGDDENLEDQISDEAPVDIYFALADTCHVWKNLTQDITSLYTPIEIVIGIKSETNDYSRVMRFIKLYPETGVWHDNLDANRFITSSDFIIKNHFAFNKIESDEKDGNEKGVCLLEILPGILDSRRSLVRNFFLWIFMGSLLDTEYSLTQSTYPVGNLQDNVQAYGYSSQHSLNPKNFYFKSSSSQNSDITSPIYNIANSMTSLYQSATSGYLFYLGSLIVFYNKVKRNSMYDSTSSPILIPYYCPYYYSEENQEKPFSLGIFPSFIAGFGDFESMTNLGHKGFDRLLGKQINAKQINLLMLSDIKIYQSTFRDDLKHCYNTVKFINDFNGNKKTLNVWNGNQEFPCKNEYDSIDSFIFFFNDKITELNSVYPRANVPESLKSITKSKKGNYCFYVYGKKFCSGVYGVTNNDLLLTRNVPITGDTNPYLSINLNFEISSSMLICDSTPDKFCPADVIGYWGISSNHDMPSYVSNFFVDSFLLDYHINTEYMNNNSLTFELGQTLAFKNDPAIYVKIIFNSPFETAILNNTELSFMIKDNLKNDIKTAHCSVQSSDVNIPSSNCKTNSISGEISCKLVYSSLQYNIFCYELDYGSGRFYFSDFKLNLPNEKTYEGLGTLYFHDTNEYILNIPNSINEPLSPTIQGNYITIPYNKYSYSKLELTIDLKRQAHPGMKIEINFDVPVIFDGKSECKFSLDKISTYSMNDIDMDQFWTKGNANIYNCKISSSPASDKTTYTIIAKIDDTLYKAGKVLSNLTYIYIWPFNTIDLSSYVELDVTVNDKYFLSYTDPLNKQIYFSSIDQQVDPSESQMNNDIIDKIVPTSNILGDLSDYEFKINKISGGGQISLVQIFFPGDINFECEECVKCYEITSDNKMSMISCNFADNNILNVFFSSSLNSISSFMVSGIINPKKSSTDLKLYFNWANIDQLGNRVSKFSSYFFIGNIFISDSDYIIIQHLRFLYYRDAISDNNPRNNATYTFNISFDYANYDYSGASLPKLNKGSILFIYFPRDYHLYINSNPSGTMVVYYYSNGVSISYNMVAKILGRKIMIEINQDTNNNVKLKYISITIRNIKNPNQIANNNKYTGYFKIVCLYKPDSSSIYYYTSGINSNTFRTNFISNEKERIGEYNWYRGHLIKTNSTYADKLIVDVLYDNKIYDFIFLQPGRYKKVHFITSSDSEKASNFYLYPNYTEISFSDSKIQTLDEKYILPSLIGEAFEFYIGVPCTTNDGIYVVTPTLSNKEAYLSPPSIIVNVRQIEVAKVEFIQDDLGFSPLNGRQRIYYYLSDINVDKLTIRWNPNFSSDIKNVYIDTINIPEKTITDKTKKLSNIFSSVTIQLKDGKQEQEGVPQNFYYFISFENINRCYELYPESLEIKERPGATFWTFESSSYKLTEDLRIVTSENDDTLLSNDIKFFFNPPEIQPSFILCELYCPYLTPEKENDLLFLDFESMNNYIKTVKQNHFRKYATNYLIPMQESVSLIFPEVIKGYNYNAQCVYQTTQSDLNLTEHKIYYLTSENLHSTFPAKTLCNTFYFLNAIKKETQQKFVNYCQYKIGTILGFSGCVVCSDNSGKIIPPGYSIYFPFNCQKEQCYDYSNNDLLSEMYDLTEDFNTNSETTKYEFTICVTSNRICSTQITNDNLNSAFNQFVNEVKDNVKANELFEIDYNDENYIIYNGFYQNKIYSEYKINIDDVNIEFVEELNYNGNAVLKASYKTEVSYNILCFWRIKLTDDEVPNIEEMTNCGVDENHCGVFVANYGGHQYKIPEGRRRNLGDGVYSMYITCSHFVPSPIYFSDIKNIMTKEIISESFSGKFLYIKYVYLFLFIFLLL